MSIRAGQAVYGEKNNGHALLAASAAASIAAEIINQMDIQGTIPPGVSWLPYWSGFAHRDWYVVARTAPDENSIRSGMVRSRALFVPLADAMVLQHLDEAMRFLCDHFDDDEPLDDLCLSDEPGPALYHGGLTTALVESGERPVVWALESGFEAALKSLWFNLWPQARASFSFSFAFSPQDVLAKPPVLVTTLPSLAPRWSGYRIVKEGPATLSPAAALLAGSAASVPLRKLMDDIDATLPTLADATLLIEIAEALKGVSDLGEGISALRIVSYLSPDPQSGRLQKAQLLKLCKDAFETASLTHVRMARNLKLDAVEEQAIFWNAMRNWSSTSLWTETDASAISATLHDALKKKGAVQAWCAAILGGLDEFVKSTDMSVGKALLPVLLAAPELLRVVVGRVPEKQKFEAALVDSIPKSLNKGSADSIIDVARQLSMNRMHAAFCASALDVAVAVDRHLVEMEHDEASLRLALRNASDKELVAISLVHDEPVLLGLAAARCASKPGLLSQLDINDAAWRRLWLKALEISPGAWNGPRHPAQVFTKLLDKMLAGELSTPLLLGALAGSPLANLSRQPRRADIWNVLPPASADLFASVTADGWIDDFLLKPDELVPEPVLAAAILNPERVHRLLERLSCEAVTGCLVFRIFPVLEEREFQSWCSKLLVNIPAISSEGAGALGRLIAARSWNLSARSLADTVIRGRSDLKPALAYCVDQIWYAQRYELNMYLGSTPAFAKWRTLEELATELYGGGPGQDGIWERAGGTKGDIPNVRTGGEAWRIMIGDIERGKRKIDVRKLIQTMADDYSHNPTLSKMRWDSFYR